jgi:hypothetical protein
MRLMTFERSAALMKSVGLITTYLQMAELARRETKVAGGEETTKDSASRAGKPASRCFVWDAFPEVVNYAAKGKMCDGSPVARERELKQNHCPGPSNKELAQGLWSMGRCLIPNVHSSGLGIRRVTVHWIVTSLSVSTPRALKCSQISSWMCLG